MLLDTKDGIWCDLCGTISKDDFVYYSVESEVVSVDSNRSVTHRGGADLDIDACEKCYQKMEDACRKFLATTMVKNTIKCDFCPNLMKGVFIYHTILLHRVTVNKEQQKDGPADVERRFMDFNLDDACFKELANKSMEVRQKIKKEGGWS